MTDRLDYGTTEDRTMPAVAYGMYLLAFATVVTAFVGLIIAYAQRERAGPKMRTHYTFLISTFWMSIVWWIIGGFLVVGGGIFSIILIGLPFLMLGGLILAMVGVWWALRCVLGIIYLTRDEAYPRPNTWLA
jgi:uncharacterized membrane protein